MRQPTWRTTKEEANDGAQLCSLLTAMEDQSVVQSGCERKRKLPEMPIGPLCLTQNRIEVPSRLLLLGRA